MKKNIGITRWGPAAGVLVVGMLAFSLSLEGAAPSPQQPTIREKVDRNLPPDSVEGDEAARDVATPKSSVPDRSGHANRPVTSDDRLPEGIRFGRVPKGDLPIMEPMLVDYRDDSGTRMRQAGLLVGSSRPDRGAVASAVCPPPPNGPCSFDIQCDDKNPCTNDVCNIAVGAPLGSGTCVNSVLANGAEGGCSDGLCCNGREVCMGGVCQPPGSGTGVFDINACQYPCTGGNVCNEDSNLCRLPCDGSNTCAITGGPCNSTPDCPPQLGNYCKNCQDGVNCNGVETCVAGVCEAGVNPCGPGGVCGERECSGPGVNACTTDSDCADLNLGTCTRPGPICFHGRCCNNSTSEPACTKRSKSGGTCSVAGGNPNGLCQSNAQCRVCVAGVNIGQMCTSNAQCPGSTCSAQGTCNVTASCDAVAGNWYATDDGRLDVQGNVCPTPPQASPDNDRTICPKYSSGVAPLVDFDTETAFLVGPFSQGPCDHVDVGDDYQFENIQPIAMEKFRWVGGGGGRLLVEFYDEFGNFIEDVVTGGVGGDIAVRSLQFIPPLTVPPKGYFVISVATNFAPNGQTFVVATTSPADEGVNLASGTNSLWFDGVRTNLLLRECVGGTNDGAWCDPADPGDSKCVGGSGVCQSRANVLAFEIEGLKVPAPTGACCNDATGVCTPNVAPWVCTGQGNNYQGNSSTCPGTCGVGACCNVNGTCSITTRGACPGAASNFQGNGTDCEPNCCTQPTVTGANNCQGVTIQNITVPAPGDDPVVRTLTGNNSTASGPDTCLQGAWNAAGGTYTTVDPGWWEAFSINSCAFVRVDFCCSNPVIEPAWALLWEGCPCNDPRFTAVNPNVPSEPANKRGGPYCEDDNLWNKFGPLPAGTYYIPVYSVPQGAHGQYQMHITVEACPVAACCNGTSCTETDQLGCANISGANFLAPPFRTSATTVCGGGTCATGSCCYVPGQALCTDVISGQLASQALCNSANGNYKGGARCKGCVCAQGSPPLSCTTDADCLGNTGPCNNPGGGVCSGQNLDQPSPCPACDIESISRCQRQPGYDGGRLSDLCIGDCVSDPALTQYVQPGIRVADDFIASVGGNVTSVCVWGVFIRNGGTGSGSNCNSSGPPEKFHITIYNDSAGVPGVSSLPGSIVGSSNATVVRKALTGTFGGREVFQWQLAPANPIPLSPGNTYWLEVYNNTDESSGFSNCDWFWAFSDPDQGADSGNQYTLQSSSPNYTFEDASFDGADLAWCISLDNTVPTLKQAACCTCGGGIGTCSVQTLENCTNADGSWQANRDSCTGTVCRNQADAADTCATDKVAVATGSHTVWNNYCSNTDGPASGGNGDCTAGLEYQNDLWYTWTATDNCNVVIETCDTAGEIDTGMMIYTNNTGTCICPSSASTERDCNDDGCTFGGSGSRLTLAATQGVCYTIRVAGYLGVKGTGILHVGACSSTPTNPPNPVADPAGLKTRFISFSVPGAATAAAGETALRVKLVTLHLVNPPYAGGPSIQFTAFQGQSVWVGPPISFVESGASQVPYRAAYTQCSPHYRDWSTVGLLHVTGSAIVPSSTYQVENVRSACQGIENTPACQSGGANVSAAVEIKTTRWGDVEIPYNPPSPTTQPDLGDVGALVNKFRGLLGAPIKARGLLIGADAFGVITVAAQNVDYGFGSIAACVDAFRGAPYPGKMGKCTGVPASGFTGACTTNAECTGAAANGAGPCRLYAAGRCTGAPTPPQNGDCSSDSQCGSGNGAGPCIPFFQCP